MDSAARIEFEEVGFLVVRSLFDQQEVEHFKTYFTEMLERGGDGWAEGGVDFEATEPLKRYPRLLQPHRGDAVAKSYMLDPRIREKFIDLVGEEPLAVQTMVYFKAPSSRGQNLHQDNLYLLARPGTCLAAWMALEDCDEENGCMEMVPGSHKLPMLCQTNNPGSEEEHWGSFETLIPPGYHSVPVKMKPGDVLFFNGSVIHGSGKNRSESRFRRTLIGHYITADCTEVAKYYFPVFRFDGSIDESIGLNDNGGPCGEFIGSDLVMSGTHNAWNAAH